MMQFDNLQFEQLMSQAVQLHTERRYVTALQLSTQAYEIAPNNSSEKGRAARDNSARHDRLGRFTEAEQWAAEAYAIHDNLVNNMEAPTPEAFRERAVTAMYVGVNGLRRAIRQIKAGDSDVDRGSLVYMRQTWTDLACAKQISPRGRGHAIDQYEINASRRVSIAESLLGDRKTGWGQKDRLAIGSKGCQGCFHV